MREKLTYYQAVREALHDELLFDENVVLLGEDIRYNLYAYTYGLVDEFGSTRIRDIPLSEAAVMGTAIGAAMCGLRPVVDFTMSSFLYVAMDQIVNMASKTIYQYNGKYRIPLTILVSSAYGNNAGAQHSDRLHSLFMGVPGLKIVVPANPQDMYSLLRISIKDDNPVICFQDKNVFYEEAEIDRSIIIPIGKANVISEGKDITLVGIQNPVNIMQKVAGRLLFEDIKCEVIDVRTVVPMDYRSILTSVKKTGRVVIADSANRSCSVAAQISSVIVEDAFDYLKAPVGIVSTDDVHLPYARSIENVLVPTEDKIENMIRKTLNYSKEKLRVQIINERELRCN